jgi:hypothetical protein
MKNLLRLSNNWLSKKLKKVLIELLGGRKQQGFYKGYLVLANVMKLLKIGIKGEWLPYGRSYDFLSNQLNPAYFNLDTD